MTDQTDDEDLNDLDNDNDNTNKGSLSEEHQKLVKAAVDEELAKIKANLDKAYKKVEETTRENVRLKEAQNEKKRKDLESEGKHAEAAKLRVAELEEQNKILNERLLSTTRDRTLEGHLAALPFRNEYARQSVFRDVLADLVQDDDGVWVHKTGASIPEYLKTIAKDPEKEFLFKQKDNQGTGQPPKGNGSGQRPKSITGLSTEELLALAEKGLLGKANF